MEIDLKIVVLMHVKPNKSEMWDNNASSYNQMSPLHPPLPEQPPPPGARAARIAYHLKISLENSKWLVSPPAPEKD